MSADFFCGLCITIATNVGEHLLTWKELGWFLLAGLLHDGSLSAATVFRFTENN
jgi:hypothetical protein